MTPPNRHSRPAVVAASVFAAFAIAASSAPAGAQSTQTLLDRARREASQIRTERDRIAAAFAEADLQQHRAEHLRDETRSEIGRIRGEVAELQESLKDRVRTAYRMRGVGFFHFLLEARSFRDFNTRLVSLQRQTLADEAVILKLRKKRAELDIKERQFADQTRDWERRKEVYREQGRRTSINLAQANALVRKYQGILSRE
jgi:peptidoglycan hydrolase CwlO-like protein